MTIPTHPFESWQQSPRPGELRLVPIGGIGEFGMNALAVHLEGTLLMVDCGQLFPSEDQPGIDSVIPDFAYLEPFAQDLEAVLLTHGHEDHLGALPYFLERWPVPVYGTALTLGILAHKLREHAIEGVELHTVEDFQKVKLARGKITAEWIPVTHSIPDACALALHTPLGTVLHSGDYKLDPEPLDGRVTGMKRLKELGRKGVRVLLGDSTNVDRPGRAPSESICRKGLREAFLGTPGKLVVATFSSQIHRIQTLLELAYEQDRKVVLVGRSLERNVATARELGRLRLPDDLFIDAREAPLFKPQRLLVLATGAQGEPLSGLARLVRGEVKGLRLGEGDRLVLSARVIPGNEVAVARLLDDTARLGVETFNQDLGPVHATGHAHGEEALELIRAARPEYVAPAHGTYRNLRAHGKLAASLGYDPEHILLLDGGQCLQLFKDGARLAGTVPVGKCFVDQGVSHWVDARVVHDRLILQEDGIVVVSLLVDPETRELVADPQVLSRGFVVLSDDEAYGRLLANAVRQAYEGAPLEVKGNRELLVELLRQTARRLIRKTTQTRPLVVPMVMEASGGQGEG